MNIESGTWSPLDGDRGTGCWPAMGCGTIQAQCTTFTQRAFFDSWMSALNAQAANNCQAQQPTPAKTVVPVDTPPARDTKDASKPLGPISLTPPMPSITAPRPTQTRPQPQGFACWVSQNPVAAVVGCGLLFLLVKGGGRG